MSKRRWVGAAILLLVALIVIYALFTTSALRLGLKQVPGLQPAEGLSGRAVGPIAAEQLVWSQDGLVVTVHGLDLDHSPWSLFAGRVELTGIAIERIEVLLPPPAEDVEAASSEGFRLDLPALDLPFDLRSAQVSIGQIVVRDAQGETLVDANLEIASLGVEDAVVSVNALRSAVVDRGELALELRLDSKRQWQGEMALDADLLAPLNSRLQLNSVGDLNALKVQLNSTGEVIGEISANLSQLPRQPLWEAQIGIELAQQAALRESLPPGPLKLALDGNGDAQGGELTGSVQAAGMALDLRPLAAKFDAGQLQLDGTAIGVAGRVSAQLEAAGQWPLQTGAEAGALRLRWSALEYAENEPPLRSESGELALRGDAEAFEFSLDANVARNELSGQLKASGEGSAERLSGVQLSLDSNAGQALLAGDYQFAPMLAAFQVDLSELKPELFAPDWPGLIDLQAQLRVTEAESIRLRADIARLGGQLRGGELSGQGEVVWVAESWPNGQLSLGWGGNQLDYSREAEQSGRLNIDARNLALGAPQLDGRLQLDLQVPQRLADWAELQGQADATDLKLPGLEVGQLRARRDGGSSTPIVVRGDALRLGERKLDRIDLRLVPQQSGDWQVSLEGAGPRLSAALEAQVSAVEQGWQGSVSQLDAEYRPLPPLSLRESAGWQLLDGALTLQRSCFAVEEGELCLTAQSLLAEGADRPDLQLDLELEQLDLQPLGRMAPELNVGVLGELSGAMRVAVAAQGDVAVSGELAAPNLRLSVPAMDGERVERQLALTINADPQVDGMQAMRVLLASELGGDLALSAQGDLSANPPDWLLSLQANALNLALADGFSPELVEPKGLLSGELQARWYDGQLAPEGQLQLREVGAELPSAGIKLSALELALTASEQGLITVQGGGQLGEGRFDLSGSLPLDPQADASLQLKGENMLVANLPIVRLTASPDLQIERSKGRVTAKGSVTIPSALIDLARFEPTVKASSDVVVVDDAPADTGPPLNLYADLRVIVGDKVRLKGFGLDGRLSGDLSLRERPGKLATGRGELDVTGSYRAYGQDLQIQRGKLLFTGGPVANPGLDLLALRELPRVKAGVRVVGAADDPQLTLYSDPPMDQAEALSYLVLGRPLNSASGDDGAQLGAAAAALGSVGGSLIASKLGAGTGLEVGVESSSDLGGAALTVGRFLTPELYFGVGQSLFESISVAILRYRLSSSWELEGISGREFKAGVNYRMER